MHFYVPEFTSFWQWLAWISIFAVLSGCSIVKVVLKETR